MHFDPPREWLYPASLEEAANVQRELAQRVRTEDEFNPVQRIAGTDVSNTLKDPENQIYAVCVSLAYPSLRVLEEGRAQVTAPLPYVPGFLGFREAPALVEAFHQLAQPPDLVLVDGHGVSHPRGLGIASHLGVLLDCPTVGVAKSILVGKPAGDLGNQPGDHVPLVWKAKPIGAVLRTRANVQPVYVSPGHRISLESAIEWVTRCLTRYRLPEPTRQAHQAANIFRKAASAVQGSLTSQSLSAPKF
jgi:deoxyribonuclease V